MNVFDDIELHILQILVYVDHANPISGMKFCLLSLAWSEEYHKNKKVSNNVCLNSLLLTIENHSSLVTNTAGFSDQMT
jgi:hypothetical protein